MLQEDIVAVNGDILFKPKLQLSIWNRNKGYIIKFNNQRIKNHTPNINAVLGV